MYVCMYARMYACMHVCMYVCICVMYVWVDVWMCGCMCLIYYVCVCLCVGLVRPIYRRDRVYIVTDGWARLLHAFMNESKDCGYHTERVIQIRVAAQC